MYSHEPPTGPGSGVTTPTAGGTKKKEQKFKTWKLFKWYGAHGVTAIHIPTSVRVASKVWKWTTAGVSYVLLLFFSFVSQLFMVEINVCGDQTKAKVECDATFWVVRERGREDEKRNAEKQERILSVSEQFLNSTQLLRRRRKCPYQSPQSFRL